MNSTKQAATLERIRTLEIQGELVILMDWSNQKWHALRQHSVTVHHPNGPEEVMDALRRLSMMIHDDQVLRGKKCPCGGDIADAEPDCNICGGKP